MVLWTAKKSLQGAADWQSVVKNPETRKIAIANTESAPYGTAAMTALEAAGLWEALKEKYVFPQTVAQAFQYALTESADAGFCAHSSALSDKAKGGFLPGPGSAAHRPGRLRSETDGEPARRRKIRRLPGLAGSKGNKGEIRISLNGPGPSLPLPETGLCDDGRPRHPGGPLTYLLVYVRFAGKSFFDALLNLPMVLPPTVLGFYLLLVMTPRGGIGRFWQAVTGSPLVFTFAGIVVASLVYSLPFAIQPMKAAFEKIDRRLLESAYVLGLSPWPRFSGSSFPTPSTGWRPRRFSSSSTPWESSG